MELPASTIPPVLQRFQKSVYLVQLSKSGKYASGKKVAQNTLILGNVEAPSARLLKCNVFLAKLQYSDVFWATFLSEAYLPEFDTCTKHTVLWKRWSPGGIVEAGSSILLDCIWHGFFIVFWFPNLDFTVMNLALFQLWINVIISLYICNS